MELSQLATQCLCARCAQHQKTCCQTSEIYVTPGDVRRIRTDTGRQDFWHRKAPDNLQYLDQDDDPMWASMVFAEGGVRRVLQRRPHGDCTFLGQKGCVLDTEVRPLVCRLYPYAYTAERITGIDPDRCPTQLLCEGEVLLDALRMNPDDAARWHHQLYREILEEAVERGQATCVSG